MGGCVSMLRILHIASEYPPLQVFGLGRAVCDLAVAQAAHGHEVHVVTNSIGGRDPDAVVDGVRVHRISFPPPPKPPDDTMAVQQFNICALQTAQAVAGRHGAPDVVHVHDWLTVLSGRMLAWLHPGARLVCTIHDTAQGKHFGRLTRPQQYAAHLERWVGQEAELIICCSDYVRGEMMDGYNVPAEKIAVIPCGVDERRWRVEGDLATYRTLFARPEERIVGYVGRLDQEKGIPTLVEAFAAALAAYPEARLVLVGKGVLQEKLHEQAQQAGIADRVRFAGYLTGPALAAFYRCCDVLVVPSLYEPFGIVALEGMISRTPVIASNAGGLAEIIQHERNGLSFPAGDAPALARELARLLGAPELGQALAERAYQDARERYDWGDIALQTVQAYGVKQQAAAAAGEG